MKTRQIILDAAFHLLEQQPFKRLTVQDILDEAGVSRRTFYRYFRDKYELQEIYYFEKAHSIFDENHLPEHMDDATWREMATGVLHFIDEHRSFYLNAGYERMPRDSLWNTLHRTISELYCQIRKKHLRQEEIGQSDQIMIECFVEGIIRLFQIFIFEKPELTLEQLLQICEGIIPKGFRTY